MDWSEENQKEIRHHIGELAALLRMKGYEGSFQVNGGQAEDLVKGLDRHFDEHNRRKALQQSLHIRTSFQGRQPNELVSCSFTLWYHAGKGFFIEQMEIERKQKNVRLSSSKRLRPGSWDRVTSKDLAVKMAQQMAYQEKMRR